MNPSQGYLLSSHFASLFLCTIMWKWIMYSALTFVDQIMKTILKNKIMQNLSTIYSWGTSRVGIKLTTRMYLSLCSIVPLFAVTCASFEITFWFHIMLWIWSWRKLVISDFWVLSLLWFQMVVCILPPLFCYSCFSSLETWGGVWEMD